MPDRNAVVVRADAAVESAVAAARPELLGAYRTGLPGARAAVLARLWGALAREPIPGIVGQHPAGGGLVVLLADGRRITGPAAAAEPFAVVDAGLAVGLDDALHDDPAALVGALGLAGAGGALAAELADSVANLALARAAQPAPDGGRPFLDRLGTGDLPDPLVDAEQLIVDGHPVHPCCRTRLGMSTVEVLRYAPEHRPVVELAVVEAPADRWLSTGSGLPPRLPLHPWQRDHVLDRYPGLRITAERVPARPLMSLRTLAPVHAPDLHLKTALGVQMTSAVRTVSSPAIHNGPLVSGLLAGLTGDLPGLTVLGEPAAGAVIVDGEPCAGLAVVHRRAPRRRPGEVVLPLAALAADSPADGRPLVAEAVTLGYAGRAAAFFADLVRLLLPPLLVCLHRGVALEAHGQNTLVVLRSGRPVRLFYRDLGGVRISPLRLARHGVAAPPLRGDLCCDDPGTLRTKLFAAALSTSVAELVAVLTREYDVPAAALWALVAGVARTTYAALPAARDDAVALFGQDLPLKAMTAMRLAERPTADLWSLLPNPLAGLR